MPEIRQAKPSPEQQAERVPQPEIELETSTDLIEELIARIREFQAKVDVVEPDPGSNPTDDGEVGVLEDYDDDAVEFEIRSFIAGLNRDQQADLITLAWLGRGDIDLGEWHERRRDAFDIEPSRIPRYLLGMPLLPDYWEEGLAALGREHAEPIPREQPPAP